VAAVAAAVREKHIGKIKGAATKAIHGDKSAAEEEAGGAYEVDGLVADVLEGDGRHGCLLVDVVVAAAS
jgi:hypothetical protein